MGDEDYDKIYSKLKFDVDKNYEYIKKILVSHKVLSAEKIDRLDKTYLKSMSKLSNKMGRLAMIAAIAALAAAGAAVFAGPIAVALIGSQFAGLNGIALVNACLAMLGGKNRQ